MNLKEAFRYQNFLTKIMNKAMDSLMDGEHCIKTTLIHKKNDVNKSAENEIENIEPSEKYYNNDIVINLVTDLIVERENLSKAITQAKRSCDIDIDAIIETNKERHKAIHGLEYMMEYKPSKTSKQGTDYTFNAEGNQTPYYYNIDIKSEYNYDYIRAKEINKTLIKEADAASLAIDKAYIETNVDFTPTFDLHDEFDDIMLSYQK